MSRAAPTPCPERTTGSDGVAAYAPTVQNIQNKIGTVAMPNRQPTMTQVRGMGSVSRASGLGIESECDKLLGELVG